MMNSKDWDDLHGIISLAWVESTDHDKFVDQLLQKIIEQRDKVRAREQR